MATQRALADKEYGHASRGGREQLQVNKVHQVLEGENAILCIKPGWLEKGQELAAACLADIAIEAHSA